MLKKLRNRKFQKKVFIFLAAIIIPAFTFWGFNSVVRSRQETGIAGKIFGRSVSLLEFKDAVEAVRIQAIMQFGDKYTEVQKYLNLDAQAWDRILVLMEAKNRRITVSDKEIVERISSLPFFLNKSGVFDERMYGEILRYVLRIDARSFEEQIRKNIMLAKLFDQITQGVSVDEKEVSTEYRKANEQVSIYYIAGLAADFAKDVLPAEEELIEYFAKNSLQFKLPLSFNIEYIAIPSDGQREEAIQQKAASILARLRKNEPFAAVAKEAGLSIKETGLYAETDPIPGIGWSSQISMLIFKARPGEYLPVAHSDKFCYLMRLKERKEPYVPEFSTIKEKVKDAYVKEKSLQIAKDKIDICEQTIKEAKEKGPKSADLEKIAKDLGVKYASTETFKFGSYIEGVGSSDAFWLNAAALKDEEVSPVISSPAGYYLMKVKSRVPVDENKFKEEKTLFTQKILNQKKEELFSKFAAQLKEKAQRY